VTTPEVAVTEFVWFYSGNKSRIIAAKSRRIVSAQILSKPDV